MNVPEFVELEFYMPFYELFSSDQNNDNPIVKQAFELEELCNKLSIAIDANILYETYKQTDYVNGDVFVFYSKGNKNTFIYLDLLKDEYDQMNMILIGVRIPMTIMADIKLIMMKLYFK